MSAAESRSGVRSSSVSRLGGVVMGFSGLLMLMAVLTLDSANQVRDINLDSANLRKQYRERSIVWYQMRADIYHASTVVRDYLIQPEHADSPKAKSTLADLQVHTYDLLQRYEAHAQADERQ